MSAYRVDMKHALCPKSSSKTITRWLIGNKTKGVEKESREINRRVGYVVLLLGNGWVGVENDDNHTLNEYVCLSVDLTLLR